MKRKIKIHWMKIKIILIKMNNKKLENKVKNSIILLIDMKTIWKMMIKISKIIIEI